MRARPKSGKFKNHLLSPFLSRGADFRKNAIQLAKTNMSFFLLRKVRTSLSLGKDNVSRRKTDGREAEQRNRDDTALLEQ